MGRIHGVRHGYMAAAVLVACASTVALAMPVGADPVTLFDTAGIAYTANVNGRDIVIKTDAPGEIPLVNEAALEVCKVTVSGRCLATGPDLSNTVSGLNNQSTAQGACNNGSCDRNNCPSTPGSGYCNYADPVEQGCSDDAGNGGPAQKDAEWDSTDQTFMTVTLRWSNTCQSNWARTKWTGDPTRLDACVGYSGGCDPSTDDMPYGTEVYGNMLYGGRGTACVSARGSTDGGGGRGTDWVITRCV